MLLARKLGHVGSTVKEGNEIQLQPVNFNRNTGVWYLAMYISQY
jgi:hypothetical protein